MTVDLLIKNGLIVDGSGMARFGGDVAVTDGIIVDVGRLHGRLAKRTIEADGCIVAPGFIDPHTHLDPQLCWDPYGLPSVLHGVTTVITGNCSVTIAPCRVADRPAVTTIFHLLEEVPIQTFDEGVDWSWESFGEYLDRLDTRTGINIGALVGHSALRYFVMGEAAYDRAASADEVEEMRRVFRSSMEAGSIGLSTSNSSFAVGDGGRPIPSRKAELTELFALCDVLGELNAGFFETDGGAGTFDFPNHVRTVAGPIAMRTGRPAVLGSTVYESSAPNRWRDVLAAIEAFQLDGARVFAQTCPGPILVNFTMQRPLMFEELPTWHQVFSLASDADKLAAYRRPEIRDALQFEGVDDTSACFFSRDWNTVTVTEVARAHNQGLVGRSVQSIADANHQRVIDTLLDLVVEEDLATRFVYPAANSGNDEAVVAMMRSPQSIIGSSDAGAHLKTLCGAGDTSLLLSRWVRERQQFSLEEAVRLITFDQASVLGLARRGLLRPGYAADMVIFDPAAIDYLPTRTVADLPGGASRLYRDAVGIQKVIVNGRPVVQDNELTGELPGRVLRGDELR